MAASANDNGHNRSDKGSSKDLQLSGKKVLLAEDDEISQDVVSGFLRISGADVRVANNGREALDLAQKEKFDLILMDTYMPEMGGIEATHKIRSLPHLKTLPIIAMTAAVTSADREKCFSAGMNDFIPKPVHPSVLMEKLAHWLQNPVAITPHKNVGKPEEVTPSDFFASATPVSKSLADLRGFDLTGLKKILNDERAMIHLLKRFHTQNTETIGKIQTALKNQQLEIAKLTVHKLKGSAANLGAQELHRAASHLDNELASGHWTKETLENFVKTFERAMEDIGKLA
jgi:two-component system, sensor histidine kinase and response regulator